MNTILDVNEGSVVWWSEELKVSCLSPANLAEVESTTIELQREKNVMHEDRIAAGLINGLAP